MQQLISYFEGQLPDMRMRLAKSKTVSEIMNVTVAALDEILNESAKAGDGITVGEERIRTAFFSPVIDALRLALKVETTEGANTNRELEVRVADKEEQNWKPAMAGVAAAAIGAAVAPGVGSAIAAGVVSGMIAAKVTSSSSWMQSTEPEKNMPRAKNMALSIPPEAVIDCVKQAILGFQGIQAEIAAAVKETEIKQATRLVSLEELPNVVDFLHVMLEARIGEPSLSPEFRSYLAIVERILSGYGFKAITYEDRTDDGQFIVREYSKDLEQAMTSRPALVKDGRIVAKGQVTLPA